MLGVPEQVTDRAGDVRLGGGGRVLTELCDEERGDSRGLRRAFEDPVQLTSWTPTNRLVSGRDEHADPVVPRVDDEHPAGPVDCDAPGREERPLARQLGQPRDHRL